MVEEDAAWRIHRPLALAAPCGRLAFAEPIRIDGDFIGAKLSQSAIAKGAVAGYRVIVPGDEVMVDGIREDSEERSAAEVGNLRMEGFAMERSVPKRRRGAAALRHMMTVIGRPPRCRAVKESGLIDRKECSH